MPRRKVDDDFIDDDGYDEDWEEEEFVGPSSDSSSDSDSEVDQFNSSNSDDSEAEPNPTSLRDDVDLDLEELQTELADLEVPFAGFTRPEHRNQRRKLHGQRIRHQTSIDLRSESPATIVEDLDFEASTPIVDNFPTPTDSERYPRRPVEIIELSSDDEAGSSSEDEDQSATQSAVQDDVGNSEEKFFSAPEGLEAVVGAKQKRRVTRRIIPDSDESDTDEPQGIEDFSTAGDLGIGGYFEGDQEEQTPQEIDYESPLATSLLLEEDGLSSDPSSTNGPRTLHLSPHPATFFAHEQFIDITKHTFENEELAVGTTVERRGTAMNGERSVFQIFRILRHEEDQNIYVEGRRFVFKSTFPYAEGTLLCQPNEVLAVAMSYRTSNTHSQEMERFPIEEVARIRKLEVITPSSDRHAVEQVNILPDVLFCQSILFLQYQNHKDRRRQRPRTKGALRNIKAEETDKATVSGQKRPIYRSKAQRGKQGAKTYTLIDFCCGCGGASEAAKLAGLRITDAVERDPFRAELYSKNFPGTSVHTEDLLNLSVKLMICTLDGDVLHLSVPCRFWSKAHTVPGKDDEVNKALLFEIPNWIEQVRPRQVTIEQVPGLIDDHYPYFLKLIFGIHALGYSVAWDVVDHKELGSGSERQRLVLIASAPDEAMPSFPKPTHGPKLKPFVTAKETLEHMYIPRSSVADHQKPSGRTVVCDPNKPFPVTLVRKRHPVRKIGGENYKILHWDNRYFTVEELAQLQQFSNERTWEGSEAQIAGMIGDAVQPKPFSHIFMEVRKTLEDTDRGDGTISRSEFDKPVALRPKDLSPFSRARIGDSELPDIEQLFAKNVPVFKPAVSRKRLSLTQPLTLPQKKQRKCR